jgi:alkylhydroperoxidase family enzyme
MLLLKLLAHAWRDLLTPPAPRLPGPRVLPSYARMGRYVAGGVTLDRRLQLLVQQLAAELVGCGWCIEHGRHLWRQAFLSPQELAGLQRYTESPHFSAPERAALAFTEALSRYAEAAGGIPDVVLAELRRHFSEPEIAALTLAATAEHLFNRRTGALGADARLASAHEGRTARWVAGSPMRNLW